MPLRARPPPRPMQRSMGNCAAGCQRRPLEPWFRAARRMPRSGGLAFVPQRAWRALAVRHVMPPLIGLTDQLGCALPPPPPSLHSFASDFNPGQVGFTPTGRAARTDGVAARVDVGVDPGVDARVNAWVDTVPVLVLFPRPEQHR